MNLNLNKEKPKIMWIDLNSAFAMAEQQAHPSLRGKPIAITNRLSKECCIIAASYEAKSMGVKVGCQRSEALALCPKLIILESDPPKYHYIYQKLFTIMKDYSPNIKMKSIDEGIIDFHSVYKNLRGQSLRDIGYEIKYRVKNEIGDYITVNIGIAPNQFLAKTAANLNKPDGLDIIDCTNLLNIYRSLKLQDLTGIADGYGSRLRAYNIHTPLQFLSAPEQLLTKQVFKSINGHYWYKRLRGWEVDNHSTKLGMIGRQWVVSTPTNDEQYLRSCLHHLAETTGIKLRFQNKQARGVCVWLSFQSGDYFTDKKTYKTAVYADQDIWLRVARLFEKRPTHMIVKTMGLYLYNLEPSSRSQTNLFTNIEQTEFLTQAVDEINNTYGIFTVFSADALIGNRYIKQKIPFGGTEYFNLLLKHQ